MRTPPSSPPPATSTTTKSIHRNNHHPTRQHTYRPPSQGETVLQHRVLQVRTNIITMGLTITYGHLIAWLALLLWLLDRLFQESNPNLPGKQPEFTREWDNKVMKMKNENEMKGDTTTLPT